MMLAPVSSHLSCPKGALRGLLFWPLHFRNAMLRHQINSQQLESLFGKIDLVATDKLRLVWDNPLRK